MALKIIFMGTPEFAVPILDSINKSKHNILSVYTQSPKKRDRGLKLRCSPNSLSIANDINGPVPVTPKFTVAIFSLFKFPAMSSSLKTQRPSAYESPNKIEFIFFSYILLEFLKPYLSLLYKLYVKSSAQEIDCLLIGPLNGIKVLFFWHL